MSYTILLVEHCVTFRHDRRLLSLLGFVHNWQTSRWSATKKENRFSLNRNGIISSFLGRQFYHFTLYLHTVKWFQAIIIIMMSCCQHGYPWPSLATPPYRSSLLAGLQGHIPYPHRTAECMFELVVLLLSGVHRRTSLMNLSLLLQQCPTCLFHLTLIVFVMGGGRSYSWGFVGCCLQDLFKIARSILV